MESIFRDGTNLWQGAVIWLGGAKSDAQERADGAGLLLLATARPPNRAAAV